MLTRSASHPAAISRSERVHARFRFAVEAGLVLAILEGLLRRALPQVGMAIMAVKFIYFPALYVVWVLMRPVPRQQLRLPLAGLAWIAIGTATTLANVAAHPVASSLGFLMNLGFVPVAFIAGKLYADPEARRACFLRLAMLCGFTGALAVFQSYLPPSHWLNMTVDGSPNLIPDRVASTFQFCNTFGNFAIGGALICFAALALSPKTRSRFMSTLSLLLIIAGAWLSGSRAGFYGCIAMIAVCFPFAPHKIRRVAIPFALVAVALVVASPFSQAVELISSGRAASTTDLSDRVTESYLGDLASQAVSLSDGIGIGWGPLTMGVSVYLDRLGINESFPDIALEGGYSLMIAETGILGLCLFVAFQFVLITQPAPFMHKFLPVGVALWGLIGNLPLNLQSIPALAIPWWFLVGMALNLPASEWKRRALRKVPVLSRWCPAHVPQHALHNVCAPLANE